MAYTFDEDVFIIDCWTDTKEKENTLKNLINKLKVYNVPIVLTGHYPVDPEIQKMVDYYLYDKNNDLLLEKDFEKYGVYSNRWTNGHGYNITNKMEFHHDYAIWQTMRMTFKFVQEVLKKKYIHFLEFDNLPDEIQYRQSFMEYLRSYDAIIYEYDKGSSKQENPYCATYIFSIRTDIANKLIEKINSKEEFFMNKPDKWQLEKNFYQRLKEITNSIFVSKYIPNNNELNIFAAWNRDGILRNGAKFQVYFGVDINDNLYIHFISGFGNQPADKDYLIEVNYFDTNEFYTIQKGAYDLVKVGKYIQGETIKMSYLGVEVINHTLNKPVEDYRYLNFVELKSKISKNRKINVNFVDGPFVEILEDGDLNYLVEFYNKENDSVDFTINLKSNCWARASKKYYVDWIVRIKGLDNDLYYEHEFDIRDKKCFISFETKSLGDNLAFIAQVEKFRIEKGAKVVCSTFHNNLFKEQYPDIEFVEPGQVVNDIYCLYRLGVFLNGDGIDRTINYENHKFDPRPLPLMKIASDILGLDYEEIKPNFKQYSTKKKKQVSIATHSTAQCKYWNNPNGWQDVVDYLKSLGYEVILLSKEENGYMGNENPKGVTQHPVGSLEKLAKTIQESELFIGISSGLSWLAWACGTPSIIISGFTDVDLEPTINVKRVINKDVCNSCWSKYTFDAGDWFWCPVHKGSERMFECSKTITSDIVINEINSILI